MKKAKQLLLLILTPVLLSPIQANAQEKKKEPTYLNHWRIGYGLNLGLPINGDYNFSIGPDIRLQYDITTKTSLSATTGYTHLFAPGDDAGFIPAKVGFKSFLGNQIYVLGEVGAAFEIIDGMGTAFLWAPGAGIATKHIDISLRYENYNEFDLGQLSLRLAYGFSSKKINNYQNSKLKSKKTPR